jgi:hypothetical protein
MLKQDQAAELLRRCELVTGRKLASVRANLLNAALRASGVWELLCIDAFAQIGGVAYETQKGKSRPDLQLSIAGCPDVSIEAAYVYPRQWENDRRARDVALWVYATARERNILESRIAYYFFGDPTNVAGPIRNLPYQHERKKVLRSTPFVSFFEAIRQRPDEVHEVVVAPYSFGVKYDPSDAGPVPPGSSVEEAPKIVNEHALYRSLEQKARQHNPSNPYIICAGSDQGTAITRHTNPAAITERDAVKAIFRKYSRLSAVIAVGVEDSLHNGFRREARSRLYRNPRAQTPLNAAHLEALSKLDFNRWKLYFALSKWDDGDTVGFARSAGHLEVAYRRGTVSMKIPSTVLVECLAGRTSLKEQYPESPDVKLLTCIEEGWDIVGCSFEPGHIEQAQSSAVTFEFARPPERVYFGP